MSDDIELEMLRDLYLKWVAFHDIKLDDLHHTKKMRAAAVLQEAHHTLENYYHPTGRTIHG